MASLLLNTVAVTGANGLIAAELVRQLLNKGYTVHGTVRSLANKAGYAHLSELPKAATNLKLFAATLEDPDSFYDAFKGVRAVFHVASPVKFSATDPVNDIINPAIAGATNTFKAALASPSVTAYLYTSSVAAIYPENNAKPGKVYSEADWEDEATPESYPYVVSKRLAEKAIYDLAKTQSKLRVVSLLPGCVWGPYVHDAGQQTLNKLPSTIGLLADIATGGADATIPAFSFPIVDIRDVAAAHIAALETPTATGRYPLHVDGQVPTFGDISKNLKRLFGSTLPLAGREPKNYAKAPIMTNRRTVKELAIKFRSVEETLIDTIAQWHDLKINLTEKRVNGQF